MKLEPSYINRTMSPTLERLASQFPALLLTGCRQSGKSTLVRHIFPNHTYVTLDQSEFRTMANDDPEYFLGLHKEPVIIDEIQYAPGIFSHLKLRIDENRSKYGRFILTGSQSFQLMKGVSESLAGRISILKLLPLSWEELELGYLEDPKAVIRHMIHGFYPEVRVRKNLDTKAWYEAYVQTYLERDVRQLQFVKDLNLFRKFLVLLGARVGTIVNISDLARDVGISPHGAREWLTILEASQIIFFLNPYFNNKGKRLIKSPKIYFEDTGILCHLLHETSVEALMVKPLAGALFENLVISEIRKQYFSRGRFPHFYFYRTAKGKEVDLILEDEGKLTPIEIKLGKSFYPDQFKELETFCTEYRTHGKWISLSPQNIQIRPAIQMEKFPPKG